MRLFVAIDFSPKEKQIFTSNAEVLKKAGVKGNFSRSENYHITLAFLGEVDKKDLGRLKNVLNSIDFKPVSVSVNGVGCFKDILIMNVEHNTALDCLANSVRTALDNGKFYYDRKPFKAHMTMAREVRFPEGKSVSELSNLTVPCTTIKDEIILFESTRIDGRLTYSKLYSKSAST
ncbi:MAG: RNA 2',3'-cyclic phosphodiesterase [Clostridiales bacterium]|nr:RNA 2',3'-cyclic phosphodiesterase [Clostridiales bacterium]